MAKKKKQQGGIVMSWKGCSVLTDAMVVDEVGRLVMDDDYMVSFGVSIHQHLFECTACSEQKRKDSQIDKGFPNPLIEARLANTNSDVE